MIKLMFPADISAQHMVRLEAEKDNTIFSEDDTLSNGAGQYMYAGSTNQLKDRRALLKFEFPDSITGDVVVDSVFLILTASNTNLTTISSPVNLHRISGEWGEGTSNAALQGGGQGARATDGDVTWKWAYYDTNEWTAAGGDFLAETSAMANVPGTGDMVS